MLHSAVAVQVARPLAHTNKTGLLCFCLHLCCKTNRFNIQVFRRLACFLPSWTRSCFVIPMQGQPYLLPKNRQREGFFYVGEISQDGLSVIKGKSLFFRQIVFIKPDDL